MTHILTKRLKMSITFVQKQSVEEVKETSEERSSRSQVTEHLEVLALPWPRRTLGDEEWQAYDRIIGTAEVDAANFPPAMKALPQHFIHFALWGRVQKALYEEESIAVVEVC